MCELCNNQGTVADHCFSRMNRILMFELENLTVMCQSCHFKKTYDQKGAVLDLYNHVSKREGEAKFRELHALSKLKIPFNNWNNRDWLERKFLWAKKLKERV